MTARAGPLAAATARAPTATARTLSDVIITIHGRHRSLACPPKASSTVRGTPYPASTVPSSSGPPCSASTYHGRATA